MYIHEMTLKLAVSALLLMSSTTLFAQTSVTPPSMPTVPTTRVLAMGHLTTGTTRATISPVMQKEVRDTVQLYLAGKIDQWYFRTDGPGGVVFILNCTSVEEAHALLEKLPLGKAGFMEFDLIPLGPLSPLNMLLQEPAAKP